MLKFNLCIIAFITIISSSYTQIDNTLEKIDQLVKDSDIIIKGEVISIESTFDDNLGKIITTNKIKVIDGLKGDIENTIQFITEGGAVDDLIQLSFHTASISTGETAYFFIRQEGDLYFLTHRKYGYVELNKSHNPRLLFLDNIFTKDEFLGLLYSKLLSEDRKSYMPISNFPCNIAEQSSFAMSLSNLQIDEFVEFDLMVKTAPTPSLFMGGKLEITLPEGLGTNIISEGRLNITPGSLLTNSDFTLNIEEIDDNKIRIELLKNNSDGIPIFQQSDLLHFSFSINDLDDILAVLDSENMQIQGNVYHNCEGRIVAYNKVVANFNGIAVTNPANSGFASITYTFSNFNCINNNTVFTFDIMAESDNDLESIFYQNAWIDFFFNPNGFFSDPISTMQGRVTKGNLIQQDEYTISVNDFGNNIFVTVNSIGCNNLLNSTPVQVLKVELDISNIAEERAFTLMNP